MQGFSRVFISTQYVILFYVRKTRLRILYPVTCCMLYISPTKRLRVLWVHVDIVYLVHKFYVDQVGLTVIGVAWDIYHFLLCCTGDTRSFVLSVVNLLSCRDCLRRFWLFFIANSELRRFCCKVIYTLTIFRKYCGIIKIFVDCLIL